MKTASAILVGIWFAISFIWLAMVSINLVTDMQYAQSAVQASQLYDAASVSILRIIAITLLIGLAYSPLEKLLNAQTNTTEEILKRSEYIANILYRLEKQLEEKQTIDQTAKPVIPDPISGTSTNRNLSEPICPKCHAKMSMRIATTGENNGKMYYVCTNYPNCKEFYSAEAVG